MLPVSFIKTTIRLRPRIVTTNVNCTWWRVTHKKIPLHLSELLFFLHSFLSRLAVRRFQCKCKSILWFMFFCYVKFSHWEFIVTLRVVLLFSFLLFAVRTDFSHWNIACDAKAKIRNFSTTIVAAIVKWKKEKWEKSFLFSHYKSAIRWCRKRKIQRQFSH